jgi:hypothetical protein
MPLTKQEYDELIELIDKDDYLVTNKVRSLTGLPPLKEYMAGNLVSIDSIAKSAIEILKRNF